MRLILIAALALMVTGCGNRAAGTETEAEAEALNKVAADLDAQHVPPPKLTE